MDKDEILKKAQQEKQGDPADRQAAKDGTLFAYLIGIFAIIIVDIINYCVLGYKNSGGDFIICSMACTVFIVKYLKLKRKHELFTAIVWGVVALISLLSWILQLCMAVKNG